MRAIEGLLPPHRLDIEARKYRELLPMLEELIMADESIGDVHEWADISANITTRIKEVLEG